MNAQHPGVEEVSVPNPVGITEALPERFVVWIHLHIAGGAEVLLELRVVTGVEILEYIRTSEEYAFRCQVNRVLGGVGPLSSDFVS